MSSEGKLIPVFRKDEGTLFSSGKYYNDITLNKFSKFLFEQISFNWEWPEATDRHLTVYLSNIMDSFCDDYKKIRQSQKMIQAMWQEYELGNFLINGSKEFENFCRYNSISDQYKQIHSYEQMIVALNEKLSNIHKKSKKILRPFIQRISETKNSETFKQVQEFNILFDKPMEFKCYIGKHYAFHEYANDYKKGQYYSPDSKLLNEIFRSSLFFHQPSCKILVGEKWTSIDEFPILDSKNTLIWHKILAHLSYENMMKIFGISNLEHFIFELIPESSEPLELTIRVERTASGYKMEFTLCETEIGFELILAKTDSRQPKFLEFKKNEMHGILTKQQERKETRTKLQKKLIGQTRTICINDHDGLSSFVFKMKESYFFSMYFKKVQKMVKDFGKTLIELRYLAFICMSFDLMKIHTYSLVFPKVIPKENNFTLIENCTNASILFDPENKTEIIGNLVEINNNKRIQIITGPNGNGKTTYVNALALNQIFCQIGWPVFATKATMSPKTDMKIHYVHSGAGISGESRFTFECKRIRELFESIYGNYPLIIMDESYTGTNYKPAEKLLSEILQACSETKQSLFMTTHHHGLIPFVESLKNGHNLYCHIDEVEGKDVPTFKILDGSSTKTNAYQVASEAGVRYEDLLKLIEERLNKVDIVLSEEEIQGDDDLPF